MPGKAQSATERAKESKYGAPDTCCVNSLALNSTLSCSILIMHWCMYVHTYAHRYRTHRVVVLLAKLRRMGSHLLTRSSKTPQSKIKVFVGYAEPESTDITGRWYLPILGNDDDEISNISNVTHRLSVSAKTNFLANSLKSICALKHDYTKLERVSNPPARVQAIAFWAE